MRCRGIIIVGGVQQKWVSAVVCNRVLTGTFCWPQVNSGVKNLAYDEVGFVSYN